jgi:hypothetical protein
MLLLRVTARLMTFLRSSALGVAGTDNPSASELLLSASSLSMPSEIWRSLVPKLKLSLLLSKSFLAMSFEKYPLFIPSTLFSGGGEDGPPLAIEELLLLKLLELCLPFLLGLNLAPWKLFKFAAPPEKPRPPIPGLAIRLGMNGFPNSDLNACGVS